jgi:SAM-dependent methyltransferase
MPTRDEVTWAYRILLGREPESEDVIRTGMIGHRDRAGLLRAFLNSDEFHARNAPRREHFPLISPPIEVEWQVEPAAMATIIRRVSEVWQELGETKPHWSVLSSDEYLPENIASTEQAFYASGEADLQIILNAILRAGRTAGDFRTVLEYGCGLGRVTHRLATTFSRVIACDISSSHLRLAHAAIDQRNCTNVSFVRAAPSHFGMTEDFDLWFSRIVLQHNPPPIIVLILRRALEKLRPRGLAIFQVPTYAPGYRFKVTDYLANLPAGEFEMHVVPQRTVFEIAQQAGCSVIEVVEDDAAGTPSWRSNFFVLEK